MTTTSALRVLAAVGVVLAAAGPTPALAAGAVVAEAETPAQAPSLRAGDGASEVHLDGLLDEPVWQRAESIPALTMVEPDEGVPASQRTEIRVLVDAHTIVIGAICDDVDPAGIVAYSKARDSELEHEDYLKIVLDTFRDGRSGYVFAVNPAGARYDALISGRGEHENEDWDEVWEAATQITAAGWSAEIRLPIRSLRFAQGLDAWGLNLERRIERLQEVSRWSGAGRDWEVTQTARAGTLTGLPRFESGIGLSVRPSLVGGVGQEGVGEEVEVSGRPSLDVTQLLGPEMLASLTLNTDFAETEVDSRQTNLTRFPLFFPEKRSFFLEGADIFDFGVGLGRDVVPFFSRRIGLVGGRQVPLRVGGKLNGRLGDTNIGALAVHTGQEEGLVPGSEMGVVRVQQNVLEESSVGFLATAGDPLGRGDAWTLGADATYQTSTFRGDKNLVVAAWALAADHEGLDRGSRTAYGLQLDYPNDIVDTYLGYKRIGDNFDPALGFVPRPGVQMLDFGFNYSPRPDWAWVRQMFHELRASWVGDLEGNWESYRVFMAPVNWRLESGDRFELNVAPAGERLVAPFEIADGVIIPPGAYHWTRYRIEAESAPKRPLSAGLTWWFGGFYGGTLHQIEAELKWNPSSLINVELSSEQNIASLPYGDFREHLLQGRVALNLSPDLQISSFLQYDNDSRSWGANTRMRWTFSPYGEIFVIHNVNVVDLGSGWLTDDNHLQVKVRYTVRR